MSSPAGRKVRLISAARHVYGGRSIAPNEIFEATEQDAEDLIAINFARRAPEIVKRAYKRRDMRAEE